MQSSSFLVLALALPPTLIVVEKLVTVWLVAGAVDVAGAL